MRGYLPKNLVSQIRGDLLSSDHDIQRLYKTVPQLALPVDGTAARSQVVSRTWKRALAATASREEAFHATQKGGDITPRCRTHEMSAICRACRQKKRQSTGSRSYSYRVRRTINAKRQRKDARSAVQPDGRSI